MITLCVVCAYVAWHVFLGVFLVKALRHWPPDPKDGLRAIGDIFARLRDGVREALDELDALDRNQ